MDVAAERGHVTRCEAVWAKREEDGPAQMLLAGAFLIFLIYPAVRAMLGF